MEANNKNKKILLIEDDPFLTELLVAELKNAGLAVTLAKTGQEGVAQFQSGAPDLVVLDLMLPDMNGFEALREIRRLPEGREVKVVVLSNVAEGPQIEEAKRLGVAASLLKINFSVAEVVEKIRQILAQQ